MMNLWKQMDYKHQVYRANKIFSSTYSSFLYIIKGDWSLICSVLRRQVNDEIPVVQVVFLQHDTLMPNPLETCALVCG